MESLKDAFATKGKKRQNSTQMAARSAFHSIILRVDGNLDGKLQSHMTDCNEAVRYGLDAQEPGTEFYVEIGRKSEGEEKRPVSIVFRENGETRLEARTMRAGIPGNIEDIEIVRGTAEDMVDFLAALNTAITGRNHFTQLEIRDPQVDAIHALRCC